MAQGIVVVGSGVDPASYYNKTQVEDKLAGKLSTSGGPLYGFIDFGQKSNGLAWKLKNGDVYNLRPYVDTNVFQLVRISADGTTSYGAFNIYEDGHVEFARHSNKKVSVMATIEADGIHAALKGNADTATNARGWVGGKATEYMDFGQTSTGLSWTCDNGDIYKIRTYAAGNVFQITRQNPNGLKEYGVFNVYADGRVTTAFPESVEVVMNYGIVASGENYIRFGDGNQICWIDNAVGGQIGTWYYPAAFVGAPAVTFQAFGNDQNCLDVVTGSDASSTNATYFAFRNAAGNYAAYKVCAIAIGRWK